ncbi:MAG: hypothetical protein RJA36_3360 [Pseudomonadota bacterium]|jgi:hemerythrin-like domain-containing protein
MSGNTDLAAMFDSLAATHRELARQLTALRRLVDAAESSGLDGSMRQEARRVLDFFNGKARQHHLDEEAHVFPPLLASPDQAVVAVARRLRQDHGWLEENWLNIEPAIAAASQGSQWFDLAELRHGLEVFDALYRDHMMLEESVAYPQARARLQAWEQAGAGREMAARRVQAAPRSPGHEA